MGQSKNKALAKMTSISGLSDSAKADKSRLEVGSFMMKAMIISMFLIDISWACQIRPIPIALKGHCFAEYYYNLDARVRNGQTVCGPKYPIAGVWEVQEDRFSCRRKQWYGSDTLHQNNKHFAGGAAGILTIPTKGIYKCCAFAKCVTDKVCVVTISRNGAADVLATLTTPTAGSGTTCTVTELQDQAKIQANLAVTDTTICLDTTSADNNKLQCTLITKT